MCVGGLANPGDPFGMEGLRKTRDNANNLFGIGNPGTRGERPSPIVNVYNEIPSIDPSDKPNRGMLAAKDSGRFRGRG